MNARSLPAAIGLTLLSCQLYAAEPMKTESLDFQFDGKRLSGTLDQPADRPPSAIVVFVLGHGKTDVVAGRWYYDLRSRFVEAGLGCYLWDKSGCGKSEGEYDRDQTVQSSAQETLAAIAELKRRGIAGSDRIGLWGISRAGWICPLVIEQLPDVAFWISVSGTDDKESFGYMLETNLRIEGRSESVVRSLITEWRRGNEIFQEGGSFEENQRATENLRQDPFFKSFFGEEKTKAAYLLEQKTFIAEHHSFDEASGLMVYVPGFRQILKEIRCPVLALFGEKDSVVDWRSTMALYKETIGRGVDADLAIKTFPSCNHNMLQCRTCGVREDRETTGPRQPCDGYQGAIITWVKEKGSFRPRRL
ncbi:MAG TPA: CocE/NonD family hydrolase [Vicinamibacteria bacterium]|jgi:pimeloyl-ACP methyl ester carboxylesterase|nr:CocE/NonD family hydrolase [Vicinamibacteria bacterium]